MAWRGYANVAFEFGDARDAEIRITFAEPALWSYVGTDALLVPAGQPTMCLGALTLQADDRAVRICVLHAFGHVLGLTHEHQPTAGWNDEPADEAAALTSKAYPPYRSARPPAPQPPPPPSAATGAETGGEVEFSAELSEERIRLDVATPAQVQVDEPFDLAVAVRQPDAPVLAIDDLPKVVSGEGSVFRPADETILKYRIEVTGANCTVTPSHYVILLRKDDNSPPRYFQVTAHKPGQQTINVSAYQEGEVLAAQTRLRLEVLISAQAPGQTRVQLVVTSLTADPLKGLKGQVIDELSKLAVTESSLGRTSLLDGIPGADTLNRNENIRRLDLDLIVTQLAQRGRLADGQIVVAKLIDNALPYASGFEIEGKLRAIQQQLA